MTKMHMPTSTINPPIPIPTSAPVAKPPFGGDADVVGNSEGSADVVGDSEGGADVVGDSEGGADVVGDSEGGAGGDSNVVGDSEGGAGGDADVVGDTEGCIGEDIAGKISGDVQGFDLAEVLVHAHTFVLLSVCV
jgi:hypothetical protein